MMTAYDTSTDDEDDEYIPAGSVILSGLVELMETTSSVLCKPVSPAYSLKLHKKLWLQRRQRPDVKHDPETNIVKVSFGKTQ